jgi:prepilin-type N-terminal cleavage/methylation domain-containing protein
MKKNLKNLLQHMSSWQKKSAPGFTVLEFLIVLAIMLVLIAIALPGLQQSRAKAEDEKRITDLRTIALGLEQYKQVCEEYPYSLDPSQPCEGKTLADFIPDLAKLNLSKLFKYVPLSYGDGDDCIGFHIGVTLRDNNQIITGSGDQNFDSSDSIFCTGFNEQGFNGKLEGVFDLHR